MYICHHNGEFDVVCQASQAFKIIYLVWFACVVGRVIAPSTKPCDRAYPHQLSVSLTPEKIESPVGNDVKPLILVSMVSFSMVKSKSTLYFITAEPITNKSSPPFLFTISSNAVSSFLNNSHIQRSDQICIRFLRASSSNKWILLPVIATCNLFSASTRANPLPIPDEAPITIAFFILSSLVWTTKLTNLIQYFKINITFVAENTLLLSTHLDPDISGRDGKLLICFSTHSTIRIYIDSHKYYFMCSYDDWYLSTVFLWFKIHH